MTKPTNPTLSIPSGFAESGDKTQFADEYLESGFDSTDPDVLSGDNLNKLIDDTYKGLNYSIDGVQDLYREGIALYDADEIYPENAIVKTVVDDNIVFYQSLTDSNQGNELTDDAMWKKVILCDSELEELSDNITTITETISNLTDIDLSNLSSSGATYMTNAGYPSSTYTSMTLGSTGTTYTAPAAGWYWLQKLSTAAGQYLTVQVFDASGTKKYQLTSQPNSSGYDAELLFPVIEDDYFSVTYSAGGSYVFRFIYAIGAES